MLEDRACCGLALIHSLARREGREVFLSGQGGDEILDARRDWPGYVFPDKLRQWSDLSGGFQTAYLTKEDFVAGALGTEGRFPYLDRTVVQEFLWLSTELKNRHYKAPLHEYMTRCGYPFDEGVKTGFCPLPGDYTWPWVRSRQIETWTLRNASLPGTGMPSAYMPGARRSNSCRRQAS